MLDFSARASPSLRNPTSFCYKSLLFCELLQVAIAICEKIFLKSGEEKEITFKINKDMFSFYKNKVKTLEKCSAVLFLKAQSGEFIKISDFEVCL